MKTFIQTLFFVLLTTQICFGQCVQNNRSGIHQISSISPKLETENNSFNDPTIAWVKQYASELVPSRDRANDVVIDIVGNIYVTGSSLKTGNSSDCLTIKYDPSGIEEWHARYNGPGNDWDEAIAISVDQVGNVYVTGNSVGLGTGRDYVTIKYNSLGNEEWVARYNGPGNYNDVVTSLAIDDSGNVYITGGSDGIGTSSDCTTIKYNSSGEEVWVARYNEPNNLSEQANALALDAHGNVYITGWCDIEGPYSGLTDYLTIKYSPSGNEIWAAHYGLENYNDKAKSIVVDELGNVYITGDGNGFCWEFSCASDYITIKYSPNGIEEWVKQYNGPGEWNDQANTIALDQNGNVYVTGQSDGSGTASDYTTIKYSSSGTEEWIARYNGPENTSDAATSIAVDSSGNIYVTGGSGVGGFWNSNNYVTIKYNPTGNEEWVSMYSGSNNNYNFARAISFDGTGNVYVTGESGIHTSEEYFSNYATIKYSQSGSEEWTTIFSSPGHSVDETTDMAVDLVGNVYVTGSSVNSSGIYSDYATIKYNSMGEEVWIARYDGPAEGNDRPTAITVDEIGNVYVTGVSEGIGTSRDYATVKYNAFGSQEWAARYNGPGNSNDGATSIAVDLSGKVYVTGGSRSATSSDYATIKYDASGNEEWVARYDAFLGNDDEIATGLAIDQAGNVYVSGHSDHMGSYGGYATIKYDSSGNEEWVSRYEDGDMQSNAIIALDSFGNLLVAGAEYVSGPSYSYTIWLTIKYSPLGSEEWVVTYGDEDSCGIATDIKIDTLGNVIVTGWSHFYSISQREDYYTTIKYSPLGNKEWAVHYNVPLYVEENINDMAVDAKGNIYITGVSNGSYTTIKYTTEGNEEWISHYSSPGIIFDKAVRVFVSEFGETDYVYVTGSSRGQGWSTYTTIKYVQNPSNVDEKGTILSTFVLEQNYPNPFNPSTKISWQSPVASQQNLEIYDVLGNKITTLVDDYKPAGRYELEFNAVNLPSGVYFYQLKAGNYIETKKMILIK